MSTFLFCLTHFHFSILISDGFHSRFRCSLFWWKPEICSTTTFMQSQSTFTAFDILSHDFISKFLWWSQTEQRIFGFCSCGEAGQTPRHTPNTIFPQTPQTFSLISFPQIEDRATKTSNGKWASVESWFFLLLVTCPSAHCQKGCTFLLWRFVYPIWGFPFYYFVGRHPFTCLSTAQISLISV